MEVILMDDVEALGHEGDIVRVAGGYARNYLIPRSLAVPATKGAKIQLERRRGAIAKREAQKSVKAKDLAEGLRQEPLHVSARGGTQGRLHGSVTTQQIADALAEQKGFEIDRRRITLAQPIREVGDYLITAQLYKGVDVELAVSVTAEIDPLEAEREAAEAESLARSEAEAAAMASLEAAEAEGEETEAGDEADVETEVEAEPEEDAPEAEEATEEPSPEE